MERNQAIRKVRGWQESEPIPMALIDDILSADKAIDFNKNCRAALWASRNLEIGDAALVHEKKASSDIPDLPGISQYRKDLKHCRRFDRREEVLMAQRIEFLQARLAYFQSMDWDDYEPSMCLERHRQFFVEGMASFAPAVAWMFHKRCRGMDPMDLVGECNLTIYDTIRLYDWRKGNRALTYMNNWLREGCQSAVYDQNRSVRIPVWAQKAMKRIRDAEKVHGDNLDAVLREADVTQEQYEDLGKVITTTVSMSAPADAEGTTELGATIPDDEVRADFEDSEFKQYLEEILDFCLTEGEIQVLKCKWGLDDGIVKSTDEAAIGDLLGWGHAIIDLLEKSALRKLKDQPNLKWLCS